MSLSIFTSASSMASTNAMNKSNNLLSTAMERLGTGKRINSAADDAAGLQIATRLQGQTNGMTVAQRNISDATALLQTAEGAFDEVSNIMYRMKDLATQAANDTNGTEDRAAISAEMKELNSELNNIMGNTKYAGENLFEPASGSTASAKFTASMNFQIGSSVDEKLTVNVAADLATIKTDLTTLSGGSVDDFDSAQSMISDLETAIGNVGTLRSSLGANINRLGHTAANLANMKDNTDLALSNIQDADYATEASTMTRNQLLAQTSMSMLKQSNSMSSMVMSLLG
ncbi:TPA: lateral flagellin LafA [Kluyvera ascorbata]|uniref:Flagellin n=1 Tax=Kluyvera genomosp. 2 TaxID=2774054 RepID=A0A2T2Y581_9ENTR|nr:MULTISPECIES: flagellin [Enterobacteriaceae]HAT3916970.1 lateral flagellin LafA [Kluyvera ascorbata]PSR47696.1 lateral flagellin LafA [Kluyvera genomosp. 2]BBQ81592.1 lateral flagellin LafA [Klebsiella sp. WP3-W18-ESBL-02]BBR18640.1 lateral flagellin LafA [Klebsiella sp. WP3-S18-ESBL-05]BBT68820.1 lateral flagellin LafA [Klebsiella sp. WP8-S18-ESBL-06]